MIHAAVSILIELYCTTIFIPSGQLTENALKIRLIAAVLQALEKLHATKKCAYFAFIKHSLLNTYCTTDSYEKPKPTIKHTPTQEGNESCFGFFKLCFSSECLGLTIQILLINPNDKNRVLS